MQRLVSRPGAEQVDEHEPRPRLELGEQSERVVDVLRDVEGVREVEAARDRVAVEVDDLAALAAWALEELRRCAGAQFDPAVVAALERMLARAASADAHKQAA